MSSSFLRCSVGFVLVKRWVLCWCNVGFCAGVAPSSLVLSVRSDFGVAPPSVCAGLGNVIWARILLEWHILFARRQCAFQYGAQCPL